MRLSKTTAIFCAAISLAFCSSADAQELQPRRVFISCITALEVDPFLSRGYFQANTVSVAKGNTGECRLTLQTTERELIGTCVPGPYAIPSEQGALACPIDLDLNQTEQVVDVHVEIGETLVNFNGTFTGERRQKDKTVRTTCGGEVLEGTLNFTSKELSFGKTGTYSQTYPEVLAGEAKGRVSCKRSR